MCLPCPLFDCIVPSRVEFKIQILFDQFLSKSMFFYHLSLSFSRFAQFAILHALTDAIVVVSFYVRSRALTILLDFHFYANDVINKTLAMSSTLFVFSVLFSCLRLVKHWNINSICIDWNERISNKKIRINSYEKWVVLRKMSEINKRFLILICYSIRCIERFINECLCLTNVNMASIFFCFIRL